MAQQMKSAQKQKKIQLMKSMLDRIPHKCHNSCCYPHAEDRTARNVL